MFDNASLMFTSIFISKSQKYWLMLPAFAKHTIFYLLLFILSKLQHKQKCDGDFWIITKTQKIKCVTTSKKSTDRLHCIDWCNGLDQLAGTRPGLNINN